MCIVGLKDIDFDPETPGCTGTLWFRPDLLERIFGACKVCHKHMAVCYGHEPKPKSIAEGKRPIAEEAAANAKRRMAAKAEKAKKGGFSF